MLATAWPAAFDDVDWWFEIKWDGYRCIAHREEGGNRLRSRRGLDLAERFPEITALDLPPGWVFDGEIVAFDDDGRPDFSLLQAGKPTIYVVFDVLYGPDGDLTRRPIEERRSYLQELAMPKGVVVDAPTRGAGVALYEAVVARGLEGIVAKRAGSLYLPGRRSPDWRKVSARRRMRGVVGGWVPGDGGRRSTFGSLLVGLWDGDELRWVGAVGSGFDDKTLREVNEALRTIERPEPPFVNVDMIPRGARWVEPLIVVEVEYKEWTRDHRLRAPVFKGLEVGSEPPLWDEEGPA